MSRQRRIQRLQRWRIGVLLGAYAILLVASIALLRLDAADGAIWRAPVALMPMIPALFGVATVVGTVKREDELQQRITLEALSFAFGGTFVVTFSYGLVQAGADAPDLSWMWVWPVMAVLWIAGGLAARRRYR